MNTMSRGCSDTHILMGETHFNYLKVHIFVFFWCCILSDFCTCKEVLLFCVFVVCDISACPAACTYSQNAAEASETRGYEKWSSTSFFNTTLCVTRRLESEALWRKHSCSRHLCCSCNIHWNHTTLTVGQNYFLSEKTPNKPSPWKLRCDGTALHEGMTL